MIGQETDKLFESGFWLGFISLYGKHRDTFLNLTFHNRCFSGYMEDAIEGRFKITGSYTTEPPFALSGIIACELNKENSKKFKGFKELESGGIFGEWENIQGRKIGSGTLSFQPCESKAEQKKASSNLNEGHKKETSLLLQRLGYSEDTSKEAAGINTELLEALSVANKMEPNANALTEEVILQIKKNNEVPEDAVSPGNVLKLMEIGFSDVDSIRTLKKNNLEAACDYLLNKAEIDDYMAHKSVKEENAKAVQNTEGGGTQDSYEEDTSESSSSEEDEEDDEEM